MLFRTGAVAEPLESRRLFAAAPAPFAAIVEGVLVVTGNRRSEQIDVGIDPDDATRFRVSRNDVPFTGAPLPLADVTRIDVLAKGGNDYVRISDDPALTIPASVVGSSGKDTIVGGNGNDTVNGGSGKDDVSGRVGDDVLIGFTGDDNLDGGEGADSLDGGTGDDFLSGQDSADTLLGQTGDDTLIGGTGADSLLGGSGADLIDGGDGDDLLNAGRNVDSVRGGTGADFFQGRYFKKEVLDFADDEDTRQFARYSKLPGDSSENPVSKALKDLLDSFF